MDRHKQTNTQTRAAQAHKIFSEQNFQNLIKIGF